MSISIRPFDAGDTDAWDSFCEDSYQATLLHTRRFLSYHSERFSDRSLILEEEGRWVGLLPAALSLQETACVVSHPGITYGGIVHQGRLQGAQMVAAMEAVMRHYAEQGCDKLLYKVVPTFYHRVPSQDDLYALFRLGARRVRCDLSSTIDLHNRQPVSQRRKRSLKKALKAGVSIVKGVRHLAALWGVLEDNLVKKHGVNPVHTLAEIELLAERFPSHIWCVCGVLDDAVVAGILLFVTPTASHAQYIASSDAGYDVSALDAVFEHCIALAHEEGKHWFDFGISTENGGTMLNEGLYGFKSEFGGGGTVHEFFEMDLSR